MTDTAKDLRGKNAEELQGRLSDLKKEQFNLRFQKASGQLTNTAQFGRVRREIARIKTILRERSSQNAAS
ncbi:MAG: 50S ribosomal protein L29 [Rhodospirillaceae bacterium]|jgi:large subunit ribosomal protein L29